jgi:hypothetical protein
MVVMGSLIEAVIYDGASRPPALAPDARTVALRGGLTMLPLVGELAEPLTHPSTPTSSASRPR